MYSMEMIGQIQLMQKLASRFLQQKVFSNFTDNSSFLYDEKEKCSALDLDRTPVSC